MLAVISPRAGLVLLALALAGPVPAQAQFWKKVTDKAKTAAEEEALGQVDKVVRGTVKCAFFDEGCIAKAKKDGNAVVLTDAEGEEVTDEDGEAITDPAEARKVVEQRTAPKPGEGAWANYDFVPGDEVLVYADYARDVVGDFPRRFDLVAGNWEVVEWEAGRYLRATAGGTVAIPLPRTLPERFTVEFPASVQHGNAYARLLPRAPRGYAGSVVSLEYAQAGLRAEGNAGPVTMASRRPEATGKTMVTVRVMADGAYMKMYVNEQRVANAPNANFARGDTLYLTVGSATEALPVLIGPIRVAGGGRDLYDRLARDGRVATQGILFDTASDVIRPESTPTLVEIGAMLTDHPDLALTIEGHTDSDGDEASNQSLSERRAAAVKAWLVAERGIAADRLVTVGFGESKPAAPNDTAEGRQQNRRVELVKQ